MSPIDPDEPFDLGEPFGGHSDIDNEYYNYGDYRADNWHEEDDREGETSMTDAEQHAAQYKTAGEAMKALDGATGVQADQDWKTGATIYTFEDGSRLKISGPEIDVMPAMTIAEKVAELFGNDGSRWIEKNGRRSLSQVCEEEGEMKEYAELRYNDEGGRVIVPVRDAVTHSDALIRHVFADGSAIVQAMSGWYIEGKEPFTRAGASSAVGQREVEAADLEGGRCSRISDR